MLSVANDNFSNSNYYSSTLATANFMQNDALQKISQKVASILLSFPGSTSYCSHRQKQHLPECIDLSKSKEEAKQLIVESLSLSPSIDLQNLDIALSHIIKHLKKEENLEEIISNTIYLIKSENIDPEYFFKINKKNLEHIIHFSKNVKSLIESKFANFTEIAESQNEANLWRTLLHFDASKFLFDSKVVDFKTLIEAKKLLAFLQKPRQLKLLVETKIADFTTLDKLDPLSLIEILDKVDEVIFIVRERYLTDFKSLAETEFGKIEAVLYQHKELNSLVQEEIGNYNTLIKLANLPLFLLKPEALISLIHAKIADLQTLDNLNVFRLEHVLRLSDKVIFLVNEAKITDSKNLFKIPENKLVLILVHAKKVKHLIDTKATDFHKLTQMDIADLYFTLTDKKLPRAPSLDGIQINSNAHYTKNDIRDSLCLSKELDLKNLEQALEKILSNGLLRRRIDHIAKSTIYLTLSKLVNPDHLFQMDPEKLKAIMYFADRVQDLMESKMLSSQELDRAQNAENLWTILSSADSFKLLRQKEPIVDFDTLMQMKEEPLELVLKYAKEVRLLVEKERMDLNTLVHKKDLSEILKKTRLQNSEL